MNYLLDTHTWIWWHLYAHKLTSKIIKLISEAANEGTLSLSSISIWEYCKLLEKKRLTLDCPGDLWIQKALELLPITIIDLSTDISWHSTNLPKPFHNDPADQIIVATARLTNATIITADKLIRKYRHVNSIWS